MTPKETPEEAKDEVEAEDSGEQSQGAVEELEVCVVGCGFSGIALAYRLQQAGLGPFLVFEKRHEVGGTWSSNTYPGCACDIPSHLYSLSFNPNPNWSRFYPSQAEILAYLKTTVSQFGLSRYIRLNTAVTQAYWRPHIQRWEVTTALTTTNQATRYYARFLVIGAGLFGVPHYPDIPGMDTFAGPSFHSSAWRHDVDLKGKRVAMIGTGASAIQVIPAIQPVVAHMTVFQRTPPWVFPKHDFAFSESTKRLLWKIPMAMDLLRRHIYWNYEHLFRPSLLGTTRLATKVGELRCRYHMRKHIKDPALRRALTPQYRLGCKRVLVSHDYYRALAQPNVVVTTGASRITRRGVVDTHGTEHPSDVIIYSTGFKVMELMSGLHVVGEGGQSLRETWKAHGPGGMPFAYLGMTICGFPNLMVLFGPNTNLGHNSVIIMIEAQSQYIISCLLQMREAKASSFHLKPGVQRAYQDEMAQRSAKTVFVTGGCDSYYVHNSQQPVAAVTNDEGSDHHQQQEEEGEHGGGGGGGGGGRRKITSTNWPGTVGEYVRRTACCHLKREYEIVEASLR